MTCKPHPPRSRPLTRTHTRFKDEHDAARAYDRAAALLLGAEAFLNFQSSDPCAEPGLLLHTAMVMLQALGRDTPLPVRRLVAAAGMRNQQAAAPVPLASNAPLRGAASAVGGAASGESAGSELGHGAPLATQRFPGASGGTSAVGGAASRGSAAAEQLAHHAPLAIRQLMGAEGCVPSFGGAASGGGAPGKQWHDAPLATWHAGGAGAGGIPGFQDSLLNICAHEGTGAVGAPGFEAGVLQSHAANARAAQLAAQQGGWQQRRWDQPPEQRQVRRQLLQLPLALQQQPQQAPQLQPAAADMLQALQALLAQHHQQQQERVLRREQQRADRPAVEPLPDSAAAPQGGQLAAALLQAGQLQARQLQTGQLAAGQLAAQQLAAGQLTAGQLQEADMCTQLLDLLMLASGMMGAADLAAAAAAQLSQPLDAAAGAGVGLHQALPLLRLQALHVASNTGAPAAAAAPDRATAAADAAAVGTPVACGTAAQQLHVTLLDAAADQEAAQALADSALHNTVTMRCQGCDMTAAAAAGASAAMAAAAAGTAPSAESPNVNTHARSDGSHCHYTARTASAADLPQANSRTCCCSTDREAEDPCGLHPARPLFTIPISGGSRGGAGCGGVGEADGAGRKGVQQAAFAPLLQRVGHLLRSQPELLMQYLQSECSWGAMGATSVGLSGDNDGCGAAALAAAVAAAAAAPAPEEGERGRKRMREGSEDGCELMHCTQAKRQAAW